MAWGHAAAPAVGRTGVGGSGQRNMGFVPAVWSGRILKSIDDKLITGKLCTREYEGFIKGHGDSVRVHRIGNIKVAPYIIASGATNWGRDTGGGAASKSFADHSGQYNRMMAIDWQVLDGASTVITVNQADYFAFEVEDIEKAQADPQYVAQATSRAGYALASAAERYNLYTMLTAAKNGTADDFGQVGGTSALTNDVL